MSDRSQTLVLRVTLAKKFKYNIKLNPWGHFYYIFDNFVLEMAIALQPSTPPVSPFIWKQKK